MCSLPPLMDGGHLPKVLSHPHLLLLIELYLKIILHVKVIHYNLPVFLVEIRDGRVHVVGLVQSVVVVRGIMLWVCKSWLSNTTTQLLGWFILDSLVWRDHPCL